MAKYKTEDTDPKVLADEADDSPEKVDLKAATAKFNLEGQKPEFQSAYADYRARMSQQKGAVVAEPDEYYKILSAMAHAHRMAKGNAAQGRQDQQPDTPQGRYSTMGTQEVYGQAGDNAADIRRLQDR